MDDPWVAVGQVLAPHGIRGEVRVRSFGAFPERFRPGLTLRLAAGPDRRLRVRRVRLHGDTVILAFEGVTDRGAAERLRGQRLLVARAERHPLPPGRYYVDDLRGLPVVTGDGRAAGRVVDVEVNPANDLLVVETAGGERALVPLVRALVHIDLEQGRIVVEDLPGLLPGTGPEEQA
ncbi:MAG TPA: ribosome maturation factor RimM [Bacillota bacterium]